MNRRKFGQLMVATALEGTFLRAGAEVAAPSALVPRFSRREIATLKLASFDRCIEVVAEAGYQGVELTGYFQKWTPEERQRLLARMRSLGVMIDMLSGLQASFAIPGQTEEFVTRVTEHCHISNALECPQINIKSGKKLESSGSTGAVHSRRRQLENAPPTWPIRMGGGGGGGGGRDRAHRSDRKSHHQH